MTRIFAISDIHYKNTIPYIKGYYFSKLEKKKLALKYFQQNNIFCIGEELAKLSTEEDILILAGDFDFYLMIPYYFKDFKGKKIIVFGNHDYWFVENFLGLDVQMNFWYPDDRFKEAKNLYKLADENYNKYFKKFEKYDLYGSYITSYIPELPKNKDSLFQMQKEYVNEKINYLEANGFIVMVDKVDPIEIEDCIIVADGLWYDYSFLKSKKVTDENLKTKKMLNTGINNDGRYIFGIEDKEFFDKKIKLYEKQLKKAKSTKKPIISVSHFLPHNTLFDNRKGTFFFCAFLGSKKIHEINIKYGVEMHLYGHVHDYKPEALKKKIKIISGIKYVNVSLFNINHLKPVWVSKK